MSEWDYFIEHQNTLYYILPDGTANRVKDIENLEWKEIEAISIPQYGDPNDDKDIKIPLSKFKEYGFTNMTVAGNYENIYYYIFTKAKLTKPSTYAQIISDFIEDYETEIIPNQKNIMDIFNRTFYFSGKNFGTDCTN